MSEEEGTRTLEEALDAFVESRMRGLRVSMPGRVESYDEVTQKADVQPLIQHGYADESGDRATRNLPVIVDVPVKFQGSGDFGMTFPINKGDTVLLVFADFSLDKWLLHGSPASAGKASPVDPLDDRSHNISDAIAIPGLRSFSAPTDQVSSDSNVIRGKTRIGSKDATESVLKGTAYASAESTWLTALDVFLTAVSSAVPGLAAALATYQTATTTFKSATTAAKSSEVLVD